MKCKHDGYLLVKTYLSGWDDYTYDTHSKVLEFSDSQNRGDRVAKTGICDQCHKRVKIPEHAKL